MKAEWLKALVLKAVLGIRGVNLLGLERGKVLESWVGLCLKQSGHLGWVQWNLHRAVGRYPRGQGLCPGGFATTRRDNVWLCAQ